MARQNAKNIVDLARMLRDSIRNFSLELHRVEADLLDTPAALEKEMRYSAAIREI
jgi:chemotaxis regulatin CheY-phosphate phosphatase CheZ